jgi:hypothetical protein
MKAILEATIQWTLLIAIRLPLTLLGFIVVPIALQSKLGSAEESRITGFDPNFTQHNTNRRWWHVGLPRWAWIWSNDRDGAKGDKRGWWDANGIVKGGSDKFLNQYWWLAFRNPVNNMRFTRFFSVNMQEATVHKVAGQALVHEKKGIYGWQILIAEGPHVHYYSFYMVQPWITIRIGHKIELWHNDTDWSQDPQKAWKGFTFRIKP